MKLQDKVALITGGAQGLGKSIALAMAREGANIVICDINPDTIPTAAAEIEALGRQCLGVRCDVSSSDSVREMYAQIADRFGTLHILVNNAALLQKGEANEAARTRFYEMVTTPIPKQSLGVTKDFTDEEWHKYWGVNVHGVFYCTREALKLMEPQKAGKIINIASIAGIGGLQRVSPRLLRDQGRGARLHPLGRRRGCGGQYLRECHRRGRHPHTADGGLSCLARRNSETACISSSRSVVSASRRNMPRSRSIWRPMSTISSGRPSVRMAE